MPFAIIADRGTLYHVGLGLRVLALHTVNNDRSIKKGMVRLPRDEWV